MEVPINKKYFHWWTFIEHLLFLSTVLQEVERQRCGRINVSYPARAFRDCPQKANNNHSSENLQRFNVGNGNTMRAFAKYPLAERTGKKLHHHDSCITISWAQKKVMGYYPTAPLPMSPLANLLPTKANRRKKCEIY